jgi:hypothetical protein
MTMVSTFADALGSTTPQPQSLSPLRGEGSTRSAAENYGRGANRRPLSSLGVRRDGGSFVPRAFLPQPLQLLLRRFHPRIAGIDFGGS